MKRLFKLFLVIILCIILVGCSNDEETITYQTITPEDAYYMINSNPDIIILDVRTKEEYDTGHLENAINMPYDEIKQNFKKDVTDNIESIIIVYCQNDPRAKEASNSLALLGYINVYTFGGIKDWTYDTTK